MFVRYFKNKRFFYLCDVIDNDYEVVEKSIRRM